jgi:hypothetical protein
MSAGLVGWWMMVTPLKVCLDRVRFPGGRLDVPRLDETTVLVPGAGAGRDPVGGRPAGD